MGPGDRGPQVSHLHHYLQKCGQLPPGPLLDEPVFDARTEQAIKAFQRLYGLDQNGRLDSDTLALMRTPRCGIPDIPGLSLVPRADPICGWPQRKLQYYIAQTLSQIGHVAHEKALLYCLRQASDATGITFTPGPQGSHIKSFTYPGDGAGGEHGRAYTPCAWSKAGEMYFDEYDVWSVLTPTPSDRLDFVSACLHELGHALGLGHSSDPSAVMYPLLQFGDQRREWQADDLDGLRYLYPPRTGITGVDALADDARGEIRPEARGKGEDRFL